MTTDSATKRWISSVADERAAAAGCQFEERRGQFVVDWLQEYLTLYEGDFAGEPFVCRDWQYEVTMRLFGWVRRSDQWGRVIRRFRKASIWVPKKNKKSPTLAAWGLYLLCGDGEQGQKVFIGAKDGAQARAICGKHAVEMVLASDRLSRECTINKNLMSITHEATRSLLVPLSSADARTQEAKEGINGSVLIDETHIVDRRFMTRIGRAGISRSEPLQIEVSTAGNNPESYGKERFDYGKQVLSGEVEDHQLLVACYEAPQDLSDADLAKDPVHYGRLANPAWGHTIGKEEFLQDYNESKGSIQGLADFKMYRLNVWQRSTNPWLRKEDWLKCGQEFDAEALHGRPCGAGLDLSRSEDMTALALVFPEDDTAGEDTEDLPVKVLVWHWLPEAAVERHAHEVPFRQWAKDAALRIIPGAVIDYRFVERDVAELLELFDVRMLAYDAHYAAPFIQRLVADRGLDERTTYIFKQTIMEFAGPTARFERLVIAGKMHHNGDPLLGWQAGHVEVKTDLNDNIRPVKPSHHDVRKIDGMVAAIMGLDASSRIPSPSPYTTRGFLTT